MGKVNESNINRIEAASSSKRNQIKPLTNTFFNILFIFVSLLCIFPVFFVFAVSVTSESSIAQYGYQLFPKELSVAAYQFLLNESAMILQATWISVVVTALGILLSVILTTAMGYVLSRREFAFSGFFTMVVFIPMIFNGGMLAGYVVNANILQLRDTVWALIIPMAVSSFNVIICKTFFRTTVPDSVIESAKIDGAGQLRIFGQIVLPISKPVLATIALFAAFSYWNDWFQASLYISNEKLQPLQGLLTSMQKNIEYIANNPYGGLSLQQYKSSMPTEGIRMAIAIIVILPIACVYPFFQRYFISGLTIGAVKG